jgi:uncharacterized protein YecT (DUF1311 family)
MIRIACLLAPVLLSTSFIFADEQDLPEPKSLAEAKIDYEAVDRELNKAWTKTRKALGDHEFEKLREDQRSWIKFRDTAALQAVPFELGDVPEGKEKETATYWSWLKSLTETRIDILRGLRGVGDPASLSGRYIDGYGGSLDIVQKDQQLFFTFMVVRGPSAHIGQINGSAKLNQTVARFSDQESGEKDKLEAQGETWLTFISERPWLRVMGTNTNYYHGARAHFDGHYIRIAELDANESAEILRDSLSSDWPSGDKEE